MTPLLLAVLLGTLPAENRVLNNDMRTPAGIYRGSVNFVVLDARVGVWSPGDGHTHRVAVFGETGSRPRNPGPLIRVKQGTEVRVFFRNRLEVPMWIYGLGKERGIQDSTRVMPDEAIEFRFVADKPGTYYYMGKTTKEFTYNRQDFDSQLNGAIIVDGPNDDRNDRIFLVSWWYGPDKNVRSNLKEGSLIAVNGATWPATERLEAKQGERQRYRWINTVAAPHPIHLHGFYYDVEGEGDGASFTRYDDPAKTVTQLVPMGGTMTMSYVPTRPGNWLMHCHFAGHMTSVEAMNMDRSSMAVEHTTHMSMAGLVMGIRVKATSYAKASYDNARNIRLIARSQPKVWGEYVGYSFALDENEPMHVPGPLLVLKKNEPVAITIVNRTHQTTAVHWHGIELESFPDGVPMFSGEGKSLLPPIAPGDSFTVRFTPPRAGTFMYHSHSNEQQQISSGLYGGIVVVDDAHPYNAETDKVLVFGDKGPLIDQLGAFPPLILNGGSDAPIELKAGTTYRFRLINISADNEAVINMKDGDQPLSWTIVARDGMELPAAKQVAAPATLHTSAGQIYDVVFTATANTKLTFNAPAGGPGSPPPTVYNAPIVVKQ